MENCVVDQSAYGLNGITHRLLLALSEVVLESSLDGNGCANCQHNVDNCIHTLCMPSMEEQLRHAIARRNELAIELAARLLSLASEDGSQSLRGQLLIGGPLGPVGARWDDWAMAVEALTAVIMQRSGVSWDVMAANVESVFSGTMSRQALHRRLSKLGEELFEEANNFYAERRTFDQPLLIRTLREYKPVRNSVAEQHILYHLPSESADLVERLAFFPSPKDIFAAPEKLASRLASWRRTPNWWTK